MKKKPIVAEDLVQRVLRIMDREITFIEEGKESTLSDTKMRMLPQFLRIILASKVDQKKDIAEESESLTILSDEELMDLYQKEKNKQQ